MNKNSWRFTAYNGKKSIVQLIHRLQKGRVTIFCNNKLLLVKDKVFEPTSISFFIDDELCAIKINQVAETFSYDFQIDKESDTPLNRMRAEMKKEEHMPKYVYVIAVVLVLVIVLWVIRLLTLS